MTLKVFDADSDLVITLLDREPKKAGDAKVVWDGKDSEGALVPVEAYFFTIEAMSKDNSQYVYDPITFSGGEVFGVNSAEFDKENQQIRYQLEHPGRVLIRLGIHRGPLMRTLVDWKPRPSGLNREPWNGKDESGFINLRDNSYFVSSITYFTLPENSIIVYGNDSLSYNSYKARQKASRPKKEERGRTLVSNRSISPHFSQPKTTYANPAIYITSPEMKAASKEGWPMLEETVFFRVDIDEAGKAAIGNRKAELYFFLDNQFIMEEGDAHFPYDLHWNCSSIPSGEHVLTVNLITDNDQVGTSSQKIIIKGRSQAIDASQPTGK